MASDGRIIVFQHQALPPYAILPSNVGAVEALPRVLVDEPRLAGFCGADNNAGLAIKRGAKRNEIT